MYFFLLQAHKEFTEDRVNAFICDLTADDLCEKVLPTSVDIVTMVLHKTVPLQILKNCFVGTKYLLAPYDVVNKFNGTTGFCVVCYCTRKDAICITECQKNS